MTRFAAERHVRDARATQHVSWKLKKAADLTTLSNTRSRARLLDGSARALSQPPTPERLPVLAATRRMAQRCGCSATLPAPRPLVDATTAHLLRAGAHRLMRS